MEINIYNSNTKRKKTSTVSFRIYKEYDQVLRRESEEKKTSLNTLVNQIFGEYVEWHALLHNSEIRFLMIGLCYHITNSE
jgi:hypothetical protein